MISCYIPTQLPSTVDSSNNNNNNNNDDDDDDDRTPRRLCGDRDSCQDSCDELFKSSSSRSTCYDLEFRDINALTFVGDSLEVKCEPVSSGRSCNMEIDNVDENDLEDIDSSDFDLYLSVGVDDFIEALESGSGSGSDAFNLLEWIGENSDIAETVLEHDEDLELGRSIFQLAGQASNEIGESGSHLFFNSRSTSEGVVVLNIDSSSDSYFAFWNRLIVHVDSSRPYATGGSFTVTANGFQNHVRSDSSNEQNVIVNRYDFDPQDVDFVVGFLERAQPELGSETFLSYSDRNENAFNWAHNTLVNFCEDLTDQDKNEVEVKQCLQAVYCAHRISEGSEEGIFRELRRYDSFVGDADERNCETDRFLEEDRMENQFE